MSAPDVNLEKQKHRHRTMVRGLWVGAAVAVIVAIGLIVSETVFDADPTDLAQTAEAVKD